MQEVIKYWDKRPCNIKHSKQPIGTLQYFDEIEKRKYFVEPHIPNFASFASQKDKSVLEIGCGIGTDAINFARAGAHYSAIEISEQSLEIAKKRFEVYNLDGKLHLCNAEKLGERFESNSFDFIYSFGVIHHTPNPRSVINEARKVIKKDGELRIMLYAKNSWKNAMIEAGYDQPEAQSGCPIAFTYDTNDIKKLLDGKFEIVKCWKDHIFPYVIEDYKNFKYTKQPWFEAMPEEIFKSLERSLGWHFLIIAKPI